MRALSCPASLKGVLSAEAAATALATGLRAGGADAVELPLADGGEGTAATLFATLGGEWRQAAVHDAFGRPRVAPWLLLPDGTAVAAGQAPSLALVYSADDPSITLLAGSAPVGDGEIALESGALAASGLAPGDTTTVVLGGEIREVTVTGEVGYSASFAGATLVLLPPVFALLVYGNYSNPDPYLAGIFFVVIAMWAGLCHTRTVTRLLAPVIALVDQRSS